MVLKQILEANLDIVSSARAATDTAVTSRRGSDQALQSLALLRPDALPAVSRGALPALNITASLTCVAAFSMRACFLAKIQRMLK